MTKLAGLTTYGGTSLVSNVEYRERVLRLEGALVREFGEGDPDIIAPIYGDLDSKLIEGDVWLTG